MLSSHLQVISSVFTGDSEAHKRPLNPYTHTLREPSRRNQSITRINTQTIGVTKQERTTLTFMASAGGGKSFGKDNLNASYRVCALQSLEMRDYPC